MSSVLASGNGSERSLLQVAAPERRRAVNAVLPALIGVAVGLALGTLLFLLLSARSGSVPNRAVLVAKLAPLVLVLVLLLVLVVVEVVTR